MAKGGSTLQEELLKQAKITNRLLAEQLKSQMGQMELVALLASSGLTARDVADVLGTTPATVAVTLMRLRSKKAKKAGGRPRHERDAEE
jgi:DNA-binding CsgD family transcriptional regulator